MQQLTMSSQDATYLFNFTSTVTGTYNISLTLENEDGIVLQERQVGQYVVKFGMIVDAVISYCVQ